ncbi:hypothetical protein LTR09_008269 [Extremus antarcticus]|uniref:N-acetyltransferase domain-containing protein n=1 Tax=Extremus antarcticus TaxID=702011 RepID=A0AAJ0DI49_9PEZI|nr:hypothetical protein LTR09_008269 [Extremus antarcticus]
MTLPVQRTAFIRKYNPEHDLQAVIRVFRETCDESLKIEPIWTLGYYIWCRPYLLLSPESCFVVDDGKGEAVGYIIGAPNSGAFCERWQEEYVPYILPELEHLPPGPGRGDEASLDIAYRTNSLGISIRSNPRKLVLGDYPDDLQNLGHLHIDLLPSHQRQGLGKHLISAFTSAVKAQGCTGLFLGMAAANHGAAKFYESCAFKRLPKVLDDGKSGELGRTAKNEDGGGTIYYVIGL